MDIEEPRGSGRFRVRLDGYVDPLTQCQVFRVEDRTGTVVSRIRAARNAQEALALYWRHAGAAMPGVTMSKDLDRRISRARAGGVGHQAMQTPELPFEPTPRDEEWAPEAAEPESLEVARESRSSALQIRRFRAKRAPTLVPQTDLFDPEDPGEPSRETLSEPPAEAAAEPEPEPEPDAAAVVPPSQETPLPPARDPGSPRDPEPRTLAPETVMLQRVDPRQLRPTDRTDSYLYHITNGTDAAVTLRQGLVVNASDPMILTERQGVSYWLSVLGEDYDYIMDGPADFVVLRLRRIAVEGLIEPDPHATRNAGCPCYLLTGRRQDG